MVAFGIACFGIIVLLLILGQSTLPLFGGDTEQAARVYKTTFMALGAGGVAGTAVWGMRVMAQYTQFLMTQHDDSSRFLRLGAWVFEHGQGWIFLFFLIAGAIMSTYIWFTEI